jgi:hypothetical protein
VNEIAPVTLASRGIKCCGAAVLLLFCTAIWAQEPVAETPADKAELPVSSEADDAASPETGAAAAVEPAGSALPASADSPFDYRASEKISEDLSVSFPVDI